MSLITTSGASNADSYATVAEADAYFAARGIGAWTGTDVAKEAALRRATSYLDNQYQGRWIGVRTKLEQSLAWPRSDGTRERYTTTLFFPLLDVDGAPIGTDEVPRKVKQAQIEVALLTLTGVKVEPTLERGGRIKSISKGVGPLQKSVTYMDGAPAVDRYLAVEGLLRGLVTSTPGASSGMVKLVRG
jgi:hypothetical protein